MSGLPKEIKIDTEIAFRALPVIRAILADPDIQDNFLYKTDVEALAKLADILLAKKYALGDRLSYSARMGVR